MNRLKQVADVRVSNVDKKSYEGEVPVRLCNYTDVYYGDVLRADTADYMEATASASQIANFRLNAGDTVLTKDSETADDIGVSAFIAESAEDFVCGYHLAVVRPRTERCDPKFLSWYLRSVPARDQLSVAATGVTRYGLRTEALANLLLDLPPLDEQRRVADFLDDQVALLDQAIALRQQQISLLKERHDTFVRDVVAKADEPAVRVVPEFPWIAGLSAAAEVKALGRILTLQRGVDLTADERVSGSVPVVTTGGVVGTHDTVIVPGPGVVIGRYGTVGSVFWINEGHWPHNTTLYVKDYQGNDPKYCFYLLRAYPYERLQARAAVPGVNRNDMHRDQMPWLPLPLQRRAAALLDEAVRRRDQFHQLHERSLSLLQERKRALITAAVTGQFDVTTARSVA